MSPKSRGRKPTSKSKAKKSPRARPTRAPGVLDAPTRTEVEQAYELLAELGTVPDDSFSVEVELTACDLLTSLLLNTPSRRFGPAFGRLVAGEAKRRGDPVALAVLTMMGRMLLTSSVRDEARAAAERLRAQGVSLPPAFARITPVRLVRADGAADVFGDQAAIVLEFERDADRFALLATLNAALGDECVSRLTVFGDPARAHEALAAELPLADGVVAPLDATGIELARRLARAAAGLAPQELDRRASDPGYVPRDGGRASGEGRRGSVEDDGYDYSTVRVAQALTPLCVSWLGDIGVEVPTHGAQPVSGEMLDLPRGGVAARVAQFLASEPGTAVRMRWARSAREWAERFETNGWFATPGRKRPSLLRLRLMLTQLAGEVSGEHVTTEEFLGAATPGPAALDARSAIAQTFARESAAYDPTSEPFAATACAWVQWLAAEAGLTPPAIERLVDQVWECCHPGLAAARAIEAVYLADGGATADRERLALAQRRMFAFPDAWVGVDHGFPPRLWLGDDRLGAVLDERSDLADRVEAIDPDDDFAQDDGDEIAIELARFDLACRALWDGESGEVSDAWAEV